MKIYTVDIEYIAYLSQKDSKILYNAKDNSSNLRKYVGIVYNINNMMYYAPLTSPKPNKPLSEKVLVDLCGGSYGHILLNNMIPCDETLVSIVDINSVADSQYKYLLQHQYEHIKAISSNIYKKATKIYKYVVESKEEFFINLCCDFKMLEDAYRAYIKLKK